MYFRVDIVNDPSSSRVVATFELPGVTNNEVTIHLNDGKLQIHGERRPRVTSQTLEGQASTPQAFSGTPDELALNSDRSPRRIPLPVQELKYGKFQRTLPVPSSLRVGVSVHIDITHTDSLFQQHTDISARFQDGMLIVTWPRSSSRDVTLLRSDSGSLSEASAAKVETVA